MDNTTQRAYLKRAEEVAAIPEQDQQYYAERLLHEYLCEFSEKERDMMLLLANHFFNAETHQLLSDAMRDNALWPEQVVSSEPTPRRLMLAEIANISQEAGEY